MRAASSLSLFLGRNLKSRAFSLRIIPGVESPFAELFEKLPVFPYLPSQMADVAGWSGAINSAKKSPDPMGGAHTWLLLYDLLVRRRLQRVSFRVCINLHDHCGWASTPHWLSIHVQTDETKDPMEGDANSCHTVGPTDGEGGEKLTQRDFKSILSTASATSSRLLLEKEKKNICIYIDLKIIMCNRRQSFFFF